MPEFNSIAELEIYLNQMTKEAMNNGNAVKETVIQAGERHVQSDVYDVYSPHVYQRTGELKKDWVSEPTAEGIAIYNNREDQGKDIAKIVDTGQGYTFSFEYSGKPRPFIENTVQELQNSSELTTALKEDLRAKGLDVL